MFTVMVFATDNGGSIFLFKLIVANVTTTRPH